MAWKKITESQKEKFLKFFAFKDKDARNEFMQKISQVEQDYDYKVEKVPLGEKAVLVKCSSIGTKSYMISGEIDRIARAFSHYSSRRDSTKKAEEFCKVAFFKWLGRRFRPNRVSADFYTANTAGNKAVRNIPAYIQELDKQSQSITNPRVQKYMFNDIESLRKLQNPGLFGHYFQDLRPLRNSEELARMMGNTTLADAMKAQLNKLRDRRRLVTGLGIGGGAAGALGLQTWKAVQDRDDANVWKQIAKHPANLVKNLGMPSLASTMRNNPITTTLGTGAIGALLAYLLYQGFFGNRNQQQ